MKNCRKDFYCYKVLPLTYDASLSYYEVLCKLTYALNELQELVEGHDDLIKELQGKVAEIEEWIANYEDELVQLEQRVNTRMDNLYNSTQEQIRNIYNEINNLYDYINAQIIISNSRTDQAIMNAKEEIYEHLSEELGKIKVINYFTGELIGVQDMFNYLASLHATDGITYGQLEGREKTYGALASLNVSYGDIVMHGNTLIV